ncbi:hypothetical protein B0186_07270 [Canicola haemoglobinophilus]|uniref:FRG domain n=1 Tax=Canicola haemoglobinophilus TaxID=733 RepID=A0A1V4B0F9_9PAST|nr:FRG domain-containing protein [Canicola haemoglobinophilus]OOR99691.1 hypothetical protein B0186_07270 [Canicola haemoglobinophilus]STO59032.1 FRG domain [Canicola haemoglobinophilus]
MTYMCKSSIPNELSIWDKNKELEFKISTYIPSIVVNGYADFKDILKTSHFKNSENSWVFRGQKEHSWFLQSTLERVNSKSLYLRENHLNRFKKECRRPFKDNIHLLETDENEIWAIGQHYGLATPLLDWTYSPYVSLFFAFEEIVENEDYRVVYALNKDNLLNRLSEYFSHEYNKLFFEPKIDPFGRLINQSGLFTIAPPCTTLEDTLIDELRKVCITRENDIADYICKIYIKSTQYERRECLSDLRKMNIHHGTLFPDLIGATKYCNQMIKEQYGVDC